jgi:hypothetical protein
MITDWNVGVVATIADRTMGFSGGCSGPLGSSPYIPSCCRLPDGTSSWAGSLSRSVPQLHKDPYHFYSSVKQKRPIHAEIEKKPDKSKMGFSALQQILKDFFTCFLFSVTPLL